MARNIRLFYFYKAFCDLLLLGPIIVIFLLSRGLSFTQIMLLNTVSAVSVVIFEVPTGAIADRIGRKNSIFLGALAMAVSMIILTFAQNFLWFSLSEIVFALGMALRSGADAALLYDSLNQLERASEYRAIEGKTHSLVYYTQAIGSVVAGFLYVVNPKLPVFLSAGFMLITAFIAALFEEPQIEKKDVCENYFAHIKESGKFVLAHRKIRSVIVFSLLFFIFYRGGFFYFQPYMQEVHIDTQYFGIIFFVFNIVAAFASKRVEGFVKRTKPHTLTALFALLPLSFLGLFLTPFSFGVGFMLFQQLARGFYRPTVFKYINKHTPSDKRATVLSFHSLMVSLPAALVYPLFGILLEKTDIFKAHGILFFICMGVGSFIYAYLKWTLSPKKTTEI